MPHRSDHLNFKHTQPPETSVAHLFLLSEKKRMKYGGENEEEENEEAGGVLCIFVGDGGGSEGVIGGEGRKKNVRAASLADQRK